MGSIWDPIESIILGVLGIIANIGAIILAWVLLWKEILLTIVGMKKPVLPKNILITGGSSGIGAALALEYARPGVHLILVARNVERLEKVKSQCIAKGATAEIQSLDMSNSQEVKRYMTEVDNRVGVDLVVANAGISMTEPRKGEIESDAAQRLFDVNVFGVFHTIAPIIEGMRQRRRGQVAIVSSLSGIWAHPGLSYYGASKTALVAFSRYYRPIAAQHDIKLTCICPGFVETPMTQELRDAGSMLPSFVFSDVNRAAKTIKSGLEKDRAIIVFPAAQYWPLFMSGAMPPYIQTVISSISRYFAVTGERQS